MTPEGWQDTQLADFLLHTARASNVVADAEYGLLGVRWYGKGCHLHDALSGSELKTTSLCRVKAGDITYNKMWVRKGAFAVVGAEHDGLFATSEYPTFQCVAAQATPDFLHWALTSPAFVRSASDLSRGTTSRARLNPRDFLTLRIALPPLGEQKKIAAILSSVDEAIEATQAVIDQLQVVKKAMMAELLTRGLPGRHSLFKQTGIGEVPEDWSVVSLGDVLADGPTNGIYKPAHLIGTGALIAGMTAIDGSTLRWTACRRAELEDTEAERFGLVEGDILVTRVYARIDGIGRFIVVPAPPETAVYESNMMRIRVARQFALPEFVALHMWLDGLRKEIEQRATLGAQASINNAGIRALPLRLPPIEEQEEIVAVISSIGCRAQAERDCLQQLGLLKSALTSVLLMGEVRVKPDEEPA